jgi:hypothetical protein
MAKRTPQSQTKHDRKVLERARALREQGFNVRADIPGFKKPDSIHGRRPDIEARKHGEPKVIEEIETPRSLKKDRPQQRVFEKYADKKDIKFKVRLAK